MKKLTKEEIINYSKQFHYEYCYPSTPNNEDMTEVCDSINRDVIISVVEAASDEELDNLNIIADQIGHLMADKLGISVNETITFTI